MGGEALPRPQCSYAPTPKLDGMPTSEGPRLAALRLDPTRSSPCFGTPTSTTGQCSFSRLFLHHRTLQQYNPYHGPGLEAVYHAVLREDVT